MNMKISKSKKKMLKNLKMIYQIMKKVSLLVIKNKKKKIKDVNINDNIE